MKNGLTILLAVCLFLLVGCGKTPEPVDVPEGTVSVDTAYYTLSVPASWQTACVYKTVASENGAYTLEYYETKNYEAFGGGVLFSIHLLSRDADYTQYPAYDYLGELAVDNAVYQVLVTYPTDVQYDIDTADSYRKVEADVKSVVASMAFKAEVTFTAAS